MLGSLGSPQLRETVPYTPKKELQRVFHTKDNTPITVLLTFHLHIQTLHGESSMRRVEVQDWSVAMEVWFDTLTGVGNIHSLNVERFHPLTISYVEMAPSGVT